MKITESEKFKLRLRIIANHIKEDKQGAAIGFAKDLRKNIRNLNNSPYATKFIWFQIALYGKRRNTTYKDKCIGDNHANTIHIQITKDKNLELDSYFYERQDWALGVYH